MLNFSLETVEEIHSLTTPQLKELLVEMSDWDHMSTDQHYKSKLYKLLSDCIMSYGSSVTLQMVVDNIDTEVGKRTGKNIKKKL